MTPRRRRAWLGPVSVATAIVAAAGCGNGLHDPPAQPGVESEALDWSVDPCADFYQFACGNWAHWHEIAGDAAVESRQYRLQADQIQRLINIVVNDARLASGTPFDETDPYAKEIGDYYNSCMAATNNPVASTLPLRDRLASIDGVTVGNLPVVIARLQKDGVSPLIYTTVTTDLSTPTRRILGMGAAARSMERAYYVDADQGQFRDAYLKHIVDLTSKVARATSLAITIDPGAVLLIETALATASLTPEQERDPHLTFNPMSAAELAAAVPHLNWTSYFAQVGVDAPARLDGPTPAYLAAVNQVLDATPLDVLKNYLRWRLIEAFATTLGNDARLEEFAFHQTLFYGAAQASPAWWSCYAATASDLGFALAHPFIAQAFGAEQRAAASTIITAIMAQMDRVLLDAPWLDDDTRRLSREKLAAVLPKVGFPDSWPNYDDLRTSSDNYLGNRIALRQLAWKQRLASLTEPADRASWSTSPVVINAFYSPQSNSILFPAAILQSPFFALGRPAAANYGAIGSVMGHELTHGFDDEGRQFDAIGGLRDWWSPSVAAEFTQRATCLVNQFRGYQPLPGTPINGALTLGENLADLGGLKLAFAAFRADDGGAGQGAPGFFTPDQQFFLSYAQTWCEKDRPQFTAEILRSDPHSPSRFRVNGTVTNVPAFATAWNCPTGTPLAPADRCVVW